MFDFLGDLLFGQQSNPADSAMPYLNQIPDVLREQLNPFITEGREAGAFTRPIYENMALNPSDFINALMRNYTPSEGYQFKEKNLTRAMQNAAAQGGYAGTPYSQLEQAENVRGLLGQDMQQFLDNVLGAQTRGLAGREAATERGYGAAGNLAGGLAGNLTQQATLGFEGQNAMNRERANRNNALMNMLGYGIGGGAHIASGGQLFGGKNMFGGFF